MKKIFLLFLFPLIFSSYFTFQTTNITKVNNSIYFKIYITPNIPDNSFIKNKTNIKPIDYFVIFDERGESKNLSDRIKNKLKLNNSLYISSKNISDTLCLLSSIFSKDNVLFLITSGDNDFSLRCIETPIYIYSDHDDKLDLIPFYNFYDLYVKARLYKKIKANGGKIVDIKFIKNIKNKNNFVGKDLEVRFFGDCNFASFPNKINEFENEKYEFYIYGNCSYLSPYFIILFKDSFGEEHYEKYKLNLSYFDKKLSNISNCINSISGYEIPTTFVNTSSYCGPAIERISGKKLIKFNKIGQYLLTEGIFNVIFPYTNGKIINKMKGNGEILLHPNSSKISTLALMVAGNSDSIEKSASELVDFTSSKILYYHHASSKNSSDFYILNKKAGICVDFSALYLSLSNSIGIKSRPVYLFIRKNNSCVFCHSFIEVWNNKWITVEPQYAYDIKPNFYLFYGNLSKEYLKNISLFSCEAVSDNGTSFTKITSLDKYCVGPYFDKEIVVNKNKTVKGIFVNLLNKKVKNIRFMIKDEKNIKTNVSYYQIPYIKKGIVEIPLFIELRNSSKEGSFNVILYYNINNQEYNSTQFVYVRPQKIYEKEIFNYLGKNKNK